MPVSYQFVNMETGEVDALNDVDRWACEQTERLYDDVNYCPLMQNVIHSAGYGSARSGPATEASFEAWKAEYLEANGPELYEKYYGVWEELVRDLVYRKWTYRCWR